jgi:hypothetical protein
VVGNPAYEPIITRNPTLQQVADLIAGARLVFDLSGPNFTPGGATPADVTVIVDNRFGNTAVTETSGLDLVALYEFDLGVHHFAAELNANYILSFKDQLTKTAPANDTLNSPFHPVDLRVRGGVNWQRAAVGASLFVNYTDSYIDDRQAPERKVGSFTTVDVGLWYTLGSPSRPLRFALNVENVFDEDPPFLRLDQISTAGLGYDPVNASGRGRFISLQLRKDW